MSTGDWFSCAFSDDDIEVIEPPPSKASKRSKSTSSNKRKLLSQASLTKVDSKDDELWLNKYKPTSVAQVRWLCVRVFNFVLKVIQ